MPLLGHYPVYVSCSPAPCAPPQAPIRRSFSNPPPTCFRIGTASSFLLCRWRPTVPMSLRQQRSTSHVRRVRGGGRSKDLDPACVDRGLVTRDDCGVAPRSEEHT